MLTIKEIRDSLGMSQSQFATAVGVDAMTVSRWERGVSQPRGALVKRELSKLEEKAKKQN